MVNKHHRILQIRLSRKTGKNLKIIKHQILRFLITDSLISRASDPVVADLLTPESPALEADQVADDSLTRALEFSMEYTQDSAM